MEGKLPSYTTVVNSIGALGRGFDVTFDIRLLYCKGVHGSRLVHTDELHTRDLTFSSSLVVSDVSIDIDIDCFSPKESRETTRVCSFHEMAEHFNKMAQVCGCNSLGSFNAMFNFTGSWQADAAATKSLVMDGSFISLFKVKLVKSNLILREDVRRAVPQTWEPSSLASFIESSGTHIITSITIGGRDVVYVKQHHSSLLSPPEISNYIKEIGDQRFSDLEGQQSSGPFKSKDKVADQFNFNSQEVHTQPLGAPNPSGKEDVTVIFRRRGGDDLVQSHTKWAETVISAPDVINMTFLPISSLLDGVPGKKHLIRAIELYLESVQPFLTSPDDEADAGYCSALFVFYNKPPIEELQYFLEFQIPHVWAPVQSVLPGQREPICPSLQFSLMGAKLFVSSEQVSVGRKPVTGLRLCLEGSKQNRLSIHLQHLASLPKIFQPHWDTHVAIGAPKWQGPEEQDSRWFEPVKWKNFSHVSTAPIEHLETCIGDLSGVHIVTGAQLGVWDFGAKSVLFLKLLFSRVPGCTISFSEACRCFFIFIFIFINLLDRSHKEG